MSAPVAGLARAFQLRAGESRTLVLLGGYLLLCTATTTILSATKNGLFLSVFPGRYIPHVVIAAALLTAAVAVVFSGVTARTARRSLALRLTVILVAVVIASRLGFGLDHRMAVGVYLLMSAVQVLALTHAWDFVGDLLTGRQAKRLAPLLGMGASIGALLGGAIVSFAARGLGTENLLVVGAALLLASLPLLWMVPEPVVPVDETSSAGRGAVRAFASGAARGFRSVASEPLLRLMAIGLVGITLTGTLIELQFKLALQSGFERDQITTVMGLMSGAVGVGTLVTQVVASRWLFPKLGVSFAAALHGGLLAFATGGAVLLGGVWVLAGLQALDDILQFSIQKPVEQVSLLPFPGPVKSATMATLGGVMRPLSKAGGGVIAIVLASRAPVISVLTAASATVAFVFLLRHRRLYMGALVKALNRHAVDFSVRTDVPLVVDREALRVIDQGLADDDPAVAVFSLSLLEQLPPAQGVPRALALLDHGTPEVRAEAAGVLGRLDLEPDQQPSASLVSALESEESAFVRASLLDTVGSWAQGETERLLPFVESPDPRVRRAALVALARWAWPDADAHLRRLLSPSAPSSDRAVGAGAVGALGAVRFLDDVARAVEDDGARPAALEALVALGAPAVPVLAGLLRRRDLPLTLRRSVITALAGVSHPDGRAALLDLVDEPAMGPAALTSLQRLRRDGRLDPVDPGRLRAALQAEVRRGLRYALVAAAMRERSQDRSGPFIAEELEGLTRRAVFRVTRLLTLSHDPTRLESARAALEAPDPGRRSNALELLEGTLSPEEGRVVMPFVEALSEGFAVERVAPLVPTADAIRRRPLETLLSDDDWWTRSLALHGLGRDGEITLPGRDRDHEEDTDMIPLIERVMILKGSQLFRYFPGSELAGIAALAEVVHLERDQVVFEQGDPGDAFYMVVRGSIRIMRGTTELALLGPREGFGEMAILDPETRSATATAAEPTTLLRIDRDSFDRLIEQNPSVARGIYRTLTQRLRNTLAQVAAG